MQAVTRPALFALALVAVALAALPAAATTYVPVVDHRLLESAAAVVETRVLAIESAPVAGRWPATDYLVEVDKVVAGEVPGRNLLVRLPGGTGPDGRVVEIDGIPRFGVGERLLLFLTPGDDGTFRVVHWMLGAFRERDVAGRRVLLRDLAGAATIPNPDGPPVEDLFAPRDAAAFTRWLSDADRGVEREADYFLPAAEAPASERVGAEYRLFERRGFNMRWFEFDSGQNVDFYMAPGGQPGFGESATANALRSAIGAWSGARGVDIRYRFAGTTTDRTQNILLFDNADDSIDSTFDCGPGGGGVLAVGGAVPSRTVRPGPNGKQYFELSDGFIVTNKNIECYLTRLPNGLAQLLAHELGHTLGIHHPCGDSGKSCDDASPLERDALMFPNIHNDDRGARINDDDRAAARELYPSSGGGGPAPAAPSGLSAVARSATEVDLAWSDNSNDETQFRIEASAAGGTWLPVGTTGANATSTTIAGLQPATDYSFRVQARRGTTPSPFSNEAQVATLPDAPRAPSALAGDTASPTRVHLTWQDESDDESGFLLEVRTPSSGAWVPVVTLPPDTTSWVVDPVLPGVPHSFRVSALGSPASSPPTDPISLTAQQPDAPCGGSPEVLCLQDRFRVTVHWHNQHAGGGFGTGTGTAFDGGESGTFWFFQPTNIELIVKVLDGRGLNEHFWVFHGSLTDVEFWISVLDTATGRSRTYYNPPSDTCGEFDTAAIAGEGLPATAAATAAAAAPTASRVAAGAETAACGDDETLCLLGGRFAVQVDWADQRTATDGTGKKVPGSDETGYFWFFDPANIEVVVKMIDARAIGQGFWAFFGTLSDVEYVVTVTDLETGEIRSYPHAQGSTCGGADTAAFPILSDAALGTL